MSSTSTMPNGEIPKPVNISPDPNKPIQILPSNGIVLVSNTQTVDGTEINGLKGRYVIESSSSYSNDTQPFVAFNNDTSKYWQCDVSGNPKYESMKSTYPKYTNNPYQLNSAITTTSKNEVAIENIYTGGGNINNTWFSTVNNVDIKGEWIQIKLPQAIYLTGYDIITPFYNGDESHSTFPKSFILVGSNDGKKWTLLDRKVDIVPPSTNKIVPPTIKYTLQPTASYSTYRLIITSMNVVDDVKISQWVLYGSLNLPISPIENTSTGTHTGTKESFLNLDCDACNSNKYNNTFINLNRGLDSMSMTSTNNKRSEYREPTAIINDNPVQKIDKSKVSNEEHLANFLLLNSTIIFIAGFIFVYM
jgi:hypothetical protein